MKNLCMIACVSQDGGLGQGGELLWHIPEDMKFFRQTTQDSTVVMGRKTFESIGRPLPKRENIILSSRPLEIAGVRSFQSQESLEDYLKSLDPAHNIYIIGGASLYQMFLEQADKLYLTEVAARKPADTYFPTFDRAEFDRQVLGEGDYEGIKYQFVEYARKARL